MMLKSIRGKRGTDNILIFRVICVVLAVALFIVTLSFAMDVAKGTLLEKNYKAKDIALLITTLYASPGVTSYEYPLSGDFTLKIGNGQVSVDDPKGEFVYWYSKPADMDDIKVTAKGSIPIEKECIGEECIGEEGPTVYSITDLDGKKILFKKDTELTAEVMLK
ncbi:MAG: hypothetical protein V1702_05860 [Candidatus Woesearchaeota archaeon]